MYNPNELPVVGRESEVEAFKQALNDAGYRGLTVLVMGTKGMGKSALLRKFREVCELHTKLDITCPDPFLLGKDDDIQTFLERLLYETFGLARASDGRSRWAGPNSKKQISAILKVAKVDALFEALTNKPGPATWIDLLQLFRRLSEKMEAKRRFVFLIDPEKYMRPDSGGAWLPVLAQLPPKISVCLRPEARRETRNATGLGGRTRA